MTPDLRAAVPATLLAAVADAICCSCPPTFHCPYTYTHHISNLANTSLVSPAAPCDQVLLAEAALRRLQTYLQALKVQVRQRDTQGGISTCVGVPWDALVRLREALTQRRPLHSNVDKNTSSCSHSAGCRALRWAPMLFPCSLSMYSPLPLPAVRPPCPSRSRVSSRHCGCKRLASCPLCLGMSPTPLQHPAASLAA